MVSHPDPEIHEVDKIVAAFCQEVAKQPLCFFSEADLQSSLYAKLIERFPETVPMGERRGPREGKKDSAPFETSRIHREYGVGGGERMDLVIFSAGSLEQAFRNYKTSDGKYLKPMFGFELGTEKSAETGDHFREDLRKLAKFPDLERGYILHFQRDMNLSDSGGPLRETTEDMLSKSFEAPIRESFPNLKSKSRVVVIRLNIGRLKKRVRGRCQIYDPTAKKGAGGWVALPEEEVAAGVLNILDWKPSRAKPKVANIPLKGSGAS